MRRLGWLCAIAVIAPLAVADAEPRRTLAAVTLRKKPGEREPAVAQLPANTVVTVLAIEGRWLRVRAHNVDGYLTRTTVSAPEPAEAPDASSAWSAPRKAGGKIVSDLLVQVVAPRAALRQDPRDDAAAVGELARGARLVVVDAATDPAWIHARAPDGRTGWIARAEIDNGASSVVVTGVDLRGIGLAGAARSSAAVRPLMVRAGLGVGFRALGMDLTSNGEGGLTNYVLDADAIAATVDVEVVKRLAGRAFVAADLRAQASDSSPGIHYPGPTAPAGTIAFRTLAGDLGARIGVRARRVFDLALRAGGHYDAFVAADVKNAGRLPRERLLGATLGARVDIVPDPTGALASRFTASVRFDVLVVGTRAQTAGLEDGTASTARALWGGVTMRYSLFPRLAIFGGYEFSRASTRWSGMSVRQPGVTSTRRVDTAQLVQIGLVTEL
jgi:SH3-like domain-containing protein